VRRRRGRLDSCGGRHSGSEGGDADANDAHDDPLLPDAAAVPRKEHRSDWHVNERSPRRIHEWDARRRWAEARRRAKVQKVRRDVKEGTGSRVVQRVCLVDDDRVSRGCP
jgi:hypothetical protein